MRTLITILLFCVAVCSKSATSGDSDWTPKQTHYGFADLCPINEYWYEDDGSVKNNSPCVSLKGDSIVNGIKYKILGCNQLGNFLYRMDDDRVYRLSEKDQQEHVVFDYSLNVGDIFTGEYETEMKVTEKTDTIIYTYGFYSIHRVLHLECVENSQIKDEWIEGVGSVNTGLLPRKTLIESHSYKVMYNLCGEIFIGFDINTPLVKACVPFVDTQYKKEEFDVDCQIVGDSLHIRGYIPLFCTEAQYLICTKKENCMEICFDIFPPDFDCWGAYKVDVSIPGFSDCNGCTLKFLTMGEDYTYEVTGMDKVKENCKEDGTVYDLTGRRLKSKPHKGIYIRNKKKHFGK